VSRVQPRGGLSIAFARLYARNERSRRLVRRLQRLPDNPAVTVRTNRRQRVDRALEAVERVVLSANDNFKRLVIFVFANFARRELHGSNRIDFKRGNSFRFALPPERVLHGNLVGEAVSLPYRYRSFAKVEMTQESDTFPRRSGHGNTKATDRVLKPKQGAV
jgi:hypothetical protein